MTPSSALPRPTWTDPERAMVQIPLFVPNARRKSTTTWGFEPYSPDSDIKDGTWKALGLFLLEWTSKGRIPWKKSLCWILPQGLSRKEHEKNQTRLPRLDCDSNLNTGKRSTQTPSQHLSYKTHSLLKTTEKPPQTTIRPSAPPFYRVAALHGILDQLFQAGDEVSPDGAANAAVVHFDDVLLHGHGGTLNEAIVNAHFAKFIPWIVQLKQGSGETIYHIPQVRGIHPDMRARHQKSRNAQQIPGSQ